MILKLQTVLSPSAPKCCYCKKEKRIHDLNVRLPFRQLYCGRCANLLDTGAIANIRRY